MAKYSFKDGCMWEGGDWEIHTDYECNEFGGGEPCRHCHHKHTTIHTNTGGDKYSVQTWICPKVIVVSNESGFNSTGLCLDCLLEAITIFDAK